MPQAFGVNSLRPGNVILHHTTLSSLVQVMAFPCSGSGHSLPEPVTTYCEQDLHVLTLNMQGPRYLRLTKSISWLLMPWLLAMPGHQQP